MNLRFTFDFRKGSLSADSVSADAPDDTISTRSSQQRGRGQPSARAGQSVSGAAEYDDEPDAFASLGRGRTVKAQVSKIFSIAIYLVFSHLIFRGWYS